MHADSTSVFKGLLAQDREPQPVRPTPPPTAAAASGATTPPIYVNVSNGGPRFSLPRRILGSLVTGWILTALIRLIFSGVPGWILAAMAGLLTLCGWAVKPPEGVTNAAHVIKEKVEHAVDHVKERATEGVDKTRERLHSIADKAGDAKERVASGVSNAKRAASFVGVLSRFGGHRGKSSDDGDDPIPTPGQEMYLRRKQISEQINQLLSQIDREHEKQADLAGMTDVKHMYKYK